MSLSTIIASVIAPASTIAMCSQVSAGEARFSDVLRAWDSHYEPLISLSAIRPGNEPKIFHHGQPTERSIVLLHGLTDSPFFLMAIGQRLYDMGFTVLIPLLPGHGLKIPAAKMNSVTLDEWKAEVDFSVGCASQLSGQVSIGGLSTGGALATWEALANPEGIRGALFLFSAALDIGDRDQFVMSSDRAVKALTIVDEKQRYGLLRGSIAALKGEQLSSSDPHLGIGDNPYRYSEMFFNGASQLAKLIQDIRSRYGQVEDRYRDLKPPVFAAHSAADSRALISEVEALVNHHSLPSRARLYRLDPRDAVEHASVVLATDIQVKTQIGTFAILEKSNPKFNDMIDDLEGFIRAHLSEIAPVPTEPAAPRH